MKDTQDVQLIALEFRIYLIDLDLFSLPDTPHLPRGRVIAKKGLLVGLFLFQL